MSSDSKLPWIIFAVLASLIVVPLVIYRVSEARRPLLKEVRIVTATESDPVFRTGPRKVASGDHVTIAAAIRVGRDDDDGVWLAPVERLEIDGVSVDHTVAGSWPEKDRVLRVFWFTIEGTFLGGDLTADNAGKLIEQRAYLAPEMGRGLLAAAVPEQHNDDQFNLGDEIIPVDGGTFRLYARVEIAEKADAVKALQSVSTRGASEALAEDFPTVSVGAALADGVAPAVGELFRLPGLEPRVDVDASWREVTTQALGADFVELVERRVVVSAWTFAAVALAGTADLDPNELHVLGDGIVGADGPRFEGRTLRWGEDIRSGDVLRDREHFIVLLGDDGDGVLGLADRVAHCWRRPPVVTSLDQAIREDAESVVWLRRGD